MELINFIVAVFSKLLIILFMLLILYIVIAITLYILTSLLMYYHSKEKYGVGSAIAWIPVARLYYLGKEVCNEGLGVTLVIIRIASLVGVFSAIQLGILNIIFKLVIYGLFLYLLSKYKDLKKIHEIENTKSKKK